MLRLIARRLVIGVLVAVTVMTLAFLLTRLSGDLAVSIAGPAATQADVEIIRKAYGLDRPLYVQFFAWTGRALVGDFGQSYFFKDSVANLIQKRLPITVTLGLVGLSERAELRGARLEAHREGTTFVLRGWIPWAA